MMFCGIDEIDITPRRETPGGAMSQFLSAVAGIRGWGEEEFLSWLWADLQQELEAIPLAEPEVRALQVISSVRPGERVIIYGDYDVDGLSATTLAMELMLARGAAVRYFIPHRFLEGYGFHVNTARKIAARGCDLLLVVDCGTKDVEALEVIDQAGIPTVVFDHHTPGDGLPKGVLVNPHCFDLPTPLTALCAAGVLWSWIWRSRIMDRSWTAARLDLACLATVADCMDLSVPLNRCIVKEGLKLIRRSPRRGIGALLGRLGVEPQDVDEEVLSMKLIPCLNAPGRLDLAEEAVRLLYPGDGSVEPLVDRVLSLNEERRRLSSVIMKDAQGDLDRHVYHGKDWPVGVLSSVASRLCNDRGRPVALVAPAGDGLRGTLRIPNGAGDAVKILSRMSHMLSAFGGHRCAAGFSVQRHHWEAVREGLEAALRELPSDRCRLDVIHWPLDRIDQSMEEDLDALGPFGMGNPAPLLYHPGGFQVEPMGRTGRVSKLLAQGREIVAFASPLELQGMEARGIVYRPKMEAWRGRRRLKLYLEKVVLSSGEGVDR
ncbi:phosphoesterase RecJ domain protein [Thermanaerovibrio acidaminovorans DSM 6589]|uniref:Single-stranded-DNA-specific exonuclease RecJ n=2 Tax=Thermanaerovibrio TaxID=81461 RepID=D1B605_THEAS|nr:phosphoesterase RecJ domain protein [Thermanaerovibrio acidaminovorans DSM 6589]